MTVGVLLITHDQIGAALLDTAVKILGRCPLHAETLSIPLNADVDALRRNAAALTRAMDEGEGVLVLTDIFGSTPSNIAAVARRGWPDLGGGRAEPADAGEGPELPPGSARRPHGEGDRRRQPRYPRVRGQAARPTRTTDRHACSPAN